ncbi:VIT1/CCC1 transporter family protein [Pediococcus parvulus]|uniref:VIT1/CCC1 transporter family protein n=1 Tax=Pediococcus parvulus TaxID=54062 RepID=UPI003757FE7E
MIRAGILGANDGIISVSGIVLGAAAANLNSYTLFISGVSGMLAGACSMVGGEFISVSAQKEVQLNRLSIQGKPARFTKLQKPIKQRLEKLMS